MNDTFMSISADALRAWRMEWAQVILQMERRFQRVPVWQLARYALCMGKPKPPEQDDDEDGDAYGLGSAVQKGEMAYTIINVEESISGDECVAASLLRAYLLPRIFPYLLEDSCAMCLLAASAALILLPPPHPPIQP